MVAKDVMHDSVVLGGGACPMHVDPIRSRIGLELVEILIEMSERVFLDRRSEGAKLLPFLTMPISWKGTLAQYVGRLHRLYAGKADVLVVDYVDAAVPVLARMAAKRRVGYRTLGYTIE